MKKPENIDSPVVQQALSWLSWLFCVPVQALDSSKKFGPDLKPAPEAFYDHEAVDVLAADICDMQKRLKEKAIRNESTFTVGDFCGLVLRLQNADPVGCQRLLKRWGRVMGVDKKPRWRRYFFKALGF